MRSISKKFFLLTITAILYVHGYAQISFENGYLINNTGLKINCIIKNIEWRNNPTEFKYKLSETSEILTGDLTNVKEFAIINSSKYIRRTVKIDKSKANNDADEYGNDRNPIYAEEEVFLKVLIEGKASLYSYENGNIKKFFYSSGTAEIVPLVYKLFINNENKIEQNTDYKQQLDNDLKCDAFVSDKISGLQYDKISLMNFFTAYNKCNNSENLAFDAKIKKGFFKISLRPRFNNSSLNIKSVIPNYYEADFGSKSGFSLGVELEFILPYNKNKWAIIVEPTFQKFKAENSADVNYISGGKLVSKVDYKSVEIPLSLRHYFFINNNSKIFINAGCVFDFSSNSFIEFSRSENGSVLSTLDIKSNNNFAFGAGYKFRNKISFEFRYQTNRKVIGQYDSWESQYQTSSIILGYTF